MSSFKQSKKVYKRHIRKLLKDIEFVVTDQPETTISKSIKSNASHANATEDYTVDHMAYFGSSQRNDPDRYQQPGDLSLNMLEGIHGLATARYHRGDNSDLMNAFAPSALVCLGVLVEEYAKYLNSDTHAPLGNLDSLVHPGDTAVHETASSDDAKATAAHAETTIKRRTSDLSLSSDTISEQKHGPQEQATQDEPDEDDWSDDSWSKAMDYEDTVDRLLDSMDPRNTSDSDSP